MISNKNFPIFGTFRNSPHNLTFLPRQHFTGVKYEETHKHLGLTRGTLEYSNYVILSIRVVNSELVQSLIR